MRILICISSLGAGGAERDVAMLAPALIHGGHHVMVVYSSGGVYEERLLAAGVPILRISDGRHHSPRVLWRFVRAVWRFRPHVIHSWLTQMDVLAGVATWVFGVPHVMSELSSALMYADTWKHRLRTRVGRRAKLIASNSAGGRDYWREHAPRTARRIIPNGLPLDEIAAAEPGLPAGLVLPDNARLIAFVGRLHPEKRATTFAHAVVGLLQDPRMALMCGEGPEHDAIASIARAGDVGSRLILPGFITNVWGVFKRADVFVNVSGYEGRPNAVIEAMACGCPVVVSDIPAHREILSPDEAVFVDGRNPDSIAAGILAVLDNPDAARARAARAQSRTASWSVRAMATAYESAYRDVLSAVTQDVPLTVES